MIVILKNTSNTCSFTLNENQTTTTHDWVFEFTHTVTGGVKTFTATDVSLYPRWNEFVIIDNSTEDAFNGTMNFELGDHTYKVYEMAQSSPVDLDTDNALALVEQGLVYVYDPYATETNYFSVDDTKSSGQFDEE